MKRKSKLSVQLIARRYSNADINAQNGVVRIVKSSPARLLSKKSYNVDIRSRWIVIKNQMPPNATRIVSRFWLVGIRAQTNAESVLCPESMGCAKRNARGLTSAATNVSSIALNIALRVQRHARRSVLTRNVQNCAKKSACYA
jgi:hypothetical protein